VRLYIYGAGMAGLLAANMLRRFNPAVREAQGMLPNNHAAVLRFRSTAVSEATNIPFKAVRLSKGIVWEDQVLGPHAATLQMTNMYAQKVGQMVMDRSMLHLEPATRYIAPPDFINLLSQGLTIEYGVPLTVERLANHERDGDIVISTIPMNTLMELVGWAPIPFRWFPITSVRATITNPPTDVYQTLYYPFAADILYRASITGNQLIAESLSSESSMAQCGLEPLTSRILRDFGFTSGKLTDIYLKHQPYGKLLPTDDAARRRFILAMTDRWRVYSLGRFATWRQLLLDDVVHDVRVIERFIMDRDDYTRTLAGRSKA
jgi:hypothetical protein